MFQSIADFTPINKVTVFWSQSLTTGTMIFKATGPSIEVDLTSQTTQTISFLGPAGAGTFAPGPLPPTPS
ncbi:hypothetical protein CVT24_007451 [Panaeolus cyanescens]|uniref:Uncharacterized protein n=1 Tax=Panaeolus cyanescens TaxID=181874 RepID=A0A409WZ11_9AGAR|nr:hypothetical protein CVT24_007451 [Panaeolus cyanescens]